MAKKRKQMWLVRWKLGKKKEWSVSPAMKYPWEVMLWIQQQKPTCEIISIEPFRRLSVPK